MRIVFPSIEYYNLSRRRRVLSEVQNALCRPNYHLRYDVLWRCYLDRQILCTLIYLSSRLNDCSTGSSLDFISFLNICIEQNPVLLYNN